LILPNVLAAHGFSPTFTVGGNNLDLAGIGRLANSTGVIFIRRATAGLPVYRLALRASIEKLVRERRNLAWSIEGGRTRTGKLRPPVLGLLKYLTEAAERVAGPDVLLVPVSVVYDQLHEVATMTDEARGGRKRPEDFRWLLRFLRSQSHRLGRAYLTIGEPILLRERAADLRAQDGADRALTLDGVLATVEPLARYMRARERLVAGAATLTDRSTIRRALSESVASGVLTCYPAGTEPVWGIGADQHLVAAFYRNAAIRFFPSWAGFEAELRTELAILASLARHAAPAPVQLSVAAGEQG